MNVVILFGAPGSGKGTAAERMRDQLGYIHVSTGDMLRQAVKKGSDVGKQSEPYMKRGELVPDEIIIRLVKDRLDADGCEKSFLFDGFPRTVAQAELLEKTLDERGSGITHVFFLDSPREVLIQRLSGRRICRECGGNYHVVNVPPRKAGICDVCGGDLYQRPDDREATIVNRLDVYNRQTQGLIARYERQGILARVNSAQSADKLVAGILDVMTRMQAVG